MGRINITARAHEDGPHLNNNKYVLCRKCEEAIVGI